jgi:hypothetical protein
MDCFEGGAAVQAAGGVVHDWWTARAERIDAELALAAPVLIASGSVEEITSLAGGGWFVAAGDNEKAGIISTMRAKYRIC